MVYKIPKIMAILNMTPDSFSDGDISMSFKHAEAKVMQMVECGVYVIDIGAESTRPGAHAISIGEEIKRLSRIIPFVHQCANTVGIKISLDSRNFETLKHFIDYIDIINDVSFGNDSRILDLVAAYKKQYCFYFSTAVPVDKTKFLPRDTNLIEFFQQWITSQYKLFSNHGISKSQLIFDPGIGFGLSTEQSFELIRQLDQIDTLGIKTLVGHSRKSFLSVSGEQDAARRDPETHAVTAYLMQKNIDYIRVHNFQETRRVLSVLSSIYNG